MITENQIIDVRFTRNFVIERQRVVGINKYSDTLERQCTSSISSYISKKKSCFTSLLSSLKNHPLYPSYQSISFNSVTGISAFPFEFPPAGAKTRRPREKETRVASIDVNFRPRGGDNGGNAGYEPARSAHRWRIDSTTANSIELLRRKSYVRKARKEVVVWNFPWSEGYNVKYSLGQR